MAHTKAFQGFVPARKKGGAYNTGSFTDIFSPTSGGACTNKIFTGDPVVLPGANFATISARDFPIWSTSSSAKV